MGCTNQFQGKLGRSPRNSWRFGRKDCCSGRDFSRRNPQCIYFRKSALKFRDFYLVFPYYPYTQALTVGFAVKEVIVAAVVVSVPEALRVASAVFIGIISLVTSVLTR